MCPGIVVWDKTVFLFLYINPKCSLNWTAVHCFGSISHIMGHDNERYQWNCHLLIIYWLKVSCGICPHVLYDFFPPLFSFDNHMEFTMTRPDDVVEYISFVLFPQRNFSWFISYSSSTEGRTGFICEEIVFFVMLLERPYSVCTWPSMSVNVSTIHCQFFVKVNHCSFFETLTNCSWKLWKIVLFSKQNCYMNLCLKTNKLHL